jgi:NAD-dependent DNA ligase
MNWNKLVSQYLIHSYLYYVLDDSVITDIEFDKICRLLLIHYDELTHENKKLVAKDALESGSGYDIQRYCPRRVKMIAIRLKDREFAFMEATKKFQEELKLIEI